MEISLREWLIIGGIVVIALILFDGWRRISASRNRLKIDIDKSLSDLGETSHHNPELPNGGARVRKYDQEPFLSETSLDAELAADQSKPVLTPVSQQSKLTGKLVSHSEAINRNTHQESEFNLHTEVDSEVEPDVAPMEVQSSMVDRVRSIDQSVVEDTPSDIPAKIPVVDPNQPAEGVSNESELPESTHQISEPSQTHELESAKLDEAEHQDSFDQQTPHQETHEVFNQESSYQDSSLQDLEWDPELAKQCDQVDARDDEPTVKVEQSISEPKGVTSNFADLDPLFDDIPTDPRPPIQSKDRAVKPDIAASTGTENHSDKEEPNLFLDLDLDQPIHQLMANKVAETKAAANREVTRRSKDKSAAGEEQTSLSLPLEPHLEPGLDDLFANFDGINPLEEISDNPIIKTAETLDTDQYNAEKFTDDAVIKPNNIDDAKSKTDTPVETHTSSLSQNLEKGRSAATTARKALSNLPDPEEVLVITVVGKNRQHLDGERLQRVVEACGMEHGDMSIYHRFEGTGAAASLQFSMANAVNPGTFDPNAMANLHTPAVSFFMSMREPRDAMTAYECMLATAETLAKNIDGDLLDEDRSVMREQTKEHYRQRIRDFEMQTRRRNLTR